MLIGELVGRTGEDHQLRLSRWRHGSLRAEYRLTGVNSLEVVPTQTRDIIRESGWVALSVVFASCR